MYLLQAKSLMMPVIIHLLQVKSFCELGCASLLGNLRGGGGGAFVHMLKEKLSLEDVCTGTLIAG